WISLCPRQKHGREFLRNRRHHAEWTTVDHRCKIRACRCVSLKQRTAGNHSARREADEAYSVRRNTPLRCMLSNNFDGLDPIGNSILSCLIHVQIRRNARSLLFHDPILKHERGNASLLKPARNTVSFYINRERYESATRGDDDAGPCRFCSLRKKGGQCRRYYVEDHGSKRCVLRTHLLVSPVFRSGGHARPDIYA